MSPSIRPEPVNLRRALDSFAQLWSPRIVTQINDYDVRIAKVAGEHVWHRHERTDELFYVLEGSLEIALREEGEERVVRLGAGDVFVVPRGVEHRPASPDGASLLLVEPSGTLTTENASDVPAHVDTTTGHPLTIDHTPVRPA